MAVRGQADDNLRSVKSFGNPVVDRVIYVQRGEEADFVGARIKRCVEAYKSQIIDLLSVNAAATHQHTEFPSSKSGNRKSSN